MKTVEFDYTLKDNTKVVRVRAKGETFDDAYILLVEEHGLTRPLELLPQIDQQILTSIVRKTFYSIPQKR